MIKSLQSLRGIFAILIFLSHYKIDGKVMMDSGGDCGVAFFIMLSGFVISAGYGDRFKNGNISYSKFISKRLGKIYPLHWLCFLWAVIIYGSFSFTTAAANLALLQSWIPKSDYYFSYNAVGWYLSDTLWFYLIFPILTIWGFGRSRLLTVLFLFVGAIYVSTLWMIPERLANAIIYVNPLARTFDFCLGIVLWQLLSSHALINIRNRANCINCFFLKSLIEVATILLLIVLLYFYPQANKNYVLSAYWWPIMATIILVFSILDIKGGIITRLLHTKVMIWFGSVSFGFFMFHVLVIRTFLPAIDRISPNMPEIWKFCLIIVSTALIAALWHRISPRIYGK